MNTSCVIENNLDSYKFFYSKYDLVISTPIHFPIIGDISIYSQGNGSLLTQKIPLRNYIGINFESREGQIEFYFPGKNGLEKGNIENFYPIDRALLDRLGLNYTVWFLSEYNWNDPPSFIANILLAKLLTDWEIQPEEIGCLDLANQDYGKILKKFLDLDKSLLDNFNFFWSIRNNSSFLWSCILSSNSHILTIERNNELEYRNMWPNYDFSSLDLSISIVDPHFVIKTNYNTRILKEIMDDVHDFSDRFGISNDRMNILEGLDHISSFYSLRLFQDVLYLYENNPLWNDFFTDIHSYRKILKSVFRKYYTSRLENKKVKQALDEATGNMWLRFFVDQIWACMDSRLVIFGEKNSIFSKELMNALSQRLGFNFTFDYSSYFDGFERDGIRIEQYKTRGTVSKFSSNKILYLCSNSWNARCPIQESVEKEILFDTTSWKIYIHGQAINSKDLLSQTFTIDLFCKLLDGDGHIVNKQLSVSSYSQNKNEMTRKIIVPFVNLFRSRIGKKLELSCDGNVEDFGIRLEMWDDVEIGIIKKS